MKQRIFTLFIMAVVCSTSAFAARYLVQVGGEGNPAWSQEAIDAATSVIELGATPLNTTSWTGAATPGDEIWIIGGTYQTTGLMTLNKTGVTFCGGFAGTETSLADRPKSDLDGNGLVEPWEFTNLTIVSAQTSTTKKFKNTTLTAGTIDGMVIEGGLNSGSGAGITVPAGQTLKNSIVRNNVITEVTSGTLYTGNIDNKGIVESCLIEKNVIDNTCTISAYGAGIGAWKETAIINNCVIRNNQNNSTHGGNTRGGGVFLKEGASIYNSVVVNNYSYGQGGGIFSDNGASTGNRIVNCIVVNNKSQNNGTGGVMMNQMGEMRNSIIFNNYRANAVDNASIGANGTTTIGIAYNCAFNGGVGGSGKYGATEGSVNNLAGTVTDYFANPNTIIGAASDATEETAINTSNWNLKSDAIISVSNFGGDLSGTDVAVLGAKDINGVVRSATPDLGAYEYAKYTITVNSSDIAQGTVSGGSGEYYFNELATVTASAISGFEFVNWTKEGSVLSTDETYKHIVTGPATLVANFDVDPTGVGIQSETQDAKVYAFGNTLFVKANESVCVEVYGVSGVKVAATSSATDHSLTLQQGSYVVVVKGADSAIRTKVAIR